MAILSSLAIGNVHAENTKRPNIVVVMADDIGSGDISYFTEKVLNKQPVLTTPNIDTLAKQGMWFDDGHSATALCAPTRYAIMSGKNNYRSYAPWGVWGMFQANAISRNEPTIGRVAQEAGYKTGFVGKWHLGGDFKLKNSNKLYRGGESKPLPQVDLNKMVAGGPKDMGFDYSFMLPDGIQGPIYLAYENEIWAPLDANSKIVHINSKNVYHPKMISDKGAGMGDTHWRTEYIGNIISQKAVDFIHQQRRETPFMLYYASPMAHLPHMPPTNFDGVKVAGTTGSSHLDMVKEMDLQVGRIISALKATNTLDNTLFIFTSDNGGLRISDTAKTGHKVSGRYRGSKNDPYEGGHRVPFIVHWPEQVKAGSFSQEPVVVQDILATIGAAIGNYQDKNQAPDSNNLLPLLTSKPGFKSRKYLMLQSGNRNETIFRQGDWKLIMKSNRKGTTFTPLALFNLKDNATEAEAKNLINRPKYKQHAMQMLAQYSEIRKSGIATAWNE
ncbi:sulfatase family protein [Thalassotalea sp. PLHSN55]|uniref:sulfatase family protein n=1 Tax=Thalassotalea sp. PLHSN55 TaxID=3435888 RepID=UPI003F861557